MGTYQDRVSADMKAAMKAGDKPRLEVLRMLISEFKRKAIDAQVDALKEDEEVAVEADEKEEEEGVMEDTSELGEDSDDVEDVVDSGEGSGEER